MSGCQESLTLEDAPTVNPIILTELGRLHEIKKIPNDIPEGYCHCGCGRKVSIYTRSFLSQGIMKGTFPNFLRGHNSRTVLNRRWSGNRYEDYNGYMRIANGKHRGVFEHVFICEKVLGKKLPKMAVIHHVNENIKDNSNRNLVMCENDKYHKLLHMRTKALKISGHADWEKCSFCQQYSPIEEIMYTSSGGKYHKLCRSRSRKELYRIKKEKEKK